VTAEETKQTRVADIYSFVELDPINKGIPPTDFDKEVDIHGASVNPGGGWSVEAFLASKDVVSG